MAASLANIFSVLDDDECDDGSALIARLKAQVVEKKEKKKNAAAVGKKNAVVEEKKNTSNTNTSAQRRAPSQSVAREHKIDNGKSDGQKAETVETEGNSDGWEVAKHRNHQRSNGNKQNGEIVNGNVEIYRQGNVKMQVYRRGNNVNFEGGQQDNGNMQGSQQGNGRFVNGRGRGRSVNGRGGRYMNECQVADSDQHTIDNSNGDKQASQEVFEKNNGKRDDNWPRGRGCGGNYRFAGGRQTQSSPELKETGVPNKPEINGEDHTENNATTEVCESETKIVETPEFVKVREIDNSITFKEYEKQLSEKRKALEAMKPAEARKVVMDKDFESMKIVSKKNEPDYIKLNSDEGAKPKKENTDRDDKKQKAVRIVIEPPPLRMHYRRQNEENGDRRGYTVGRGGYSRPPSSSTQNGEAARTNSSAATDCDGKQTVEQTNSGNNGGFRRASNEVVSDSRVCYNCKKPGHVKSKCPDFVSDSKNGGNRGTNDSNGLVVAEKKKKDNVVVPAITIEYSNQFPSLVARSVKA